LKVEDLGPFVGQKAEVSFFDLSHHNTDILFLL